MRGSEDAAAGTVLQRLIQEQLRYGTPTENMNLLAIQHQATGSAGPAHPTNNFSSTENLTQEDPQMVYQSARQEPQGQEHQVDNTVLKHPATKGTAEKLENSSGHGKSPDHKGRVSSLLHKPEFPDGEMMEVLI
uniref:Angiomotin like 1 n=1 Tax=Rousettus aegyptiacus TaxID=9407 RepID=A0A7J8GVV5_ROUAE|nr:angiomotin like 1 [Rousettus aegyptiacus]